MHFDNRSEFEEQVRSILRSRPFGVKPVGHRRDDQRAITAALLKSIDLYSGVYKAFGVLKARSGSVYFDFTDPLAELPVKMTAFVASLRAKSDAADSHFDLLLERLDETARIEGKQHTSSYARGRSCFKSQVLEGLDLELPFLLDEAYRLSLDTVPSSLDRFWRFYPGFFGLPSGSAAVVGGMVAPGAHAVVPSGTLTPYRRVVRSTATPLWVTSKERLASRDEHAGGRGGKPPVPELQEILDELAEPRGIGNLSYPLGLAHSLSAADLLYVYYGTYADHSLQAYPGHVEFASHLADYIGGDGTTTWFEKQKSRLKKFLIAHLEGLCRKRPGFVKLRPDYRDAIRAGTVVRRSSHAPAYIFDDDTVELMR